MDLPLDSIGLPPWDPAQADERDEAFEKVENYLRACRVASRLHRARLAALLIHRAIARREAGAPAPLASLAIEEARAAMDGWIRGALGGEAADARAFLALYLCDGYLRWPNAFLGGQIPREFADALKAGVVRTGPALQVSSMVPRAIDYGLLPELAGDAMEKLETAPLLKAAIVWLLILAGLVALFLRSRGIVLP